MDFKQVFIGIFLLVLALILTGLLILSLKSDTEVLKGQVSTLQEFIDSQKEWNKRCVKSIRGTMLGHQNPTTPIVCICTRGSGKIVFYDELEDIETTRNN